MLLMAKILSNKQLDQFLLIGYAYHFLYIQLVEVIAFQIIVKDTQLSFYQPIHFDDIEISIY